MPVRGQRLVRVGKPACGAEFCSGLGAFGDLGSRSGRPVTRGAICHLHHFLLSPGPVGGPFCRLHCTIARVQDVFKESFVEDRHPRTLMTHSGPWTRRGNVLRTEVGTTGLGKGAEEPLRFARARAGGTA